MRSRIIQFSLSSCNKKEVLSCPFLFAYSLPLFLIAATPKENMIQELAKALDCNYRSIYEPSLYAAEDVMYALFELDEHYDMNLYEVANPDDPTEKHITVGFDYSLLDDFLSNWKKKKRT